MPAKSAQSDKYLRHLRPFSGNLAIKFAERPELSLRWYPPQWIGALPVGPLHALATDAFVDLKWLGRNRNLWGSHERFEESYGCDQEEGTKIQHPSKALGIGRAFTRLGSTAGRGRNDPGRFSALNQL